MGMCDRASEDGLGVYPGNKLMAQYVSVTDRQVRRLLHDLEVDGWIRRDKYPKGGHGHAVEWEINVDKVFDEARAAGWAQKRTRTSTSTFGKEPGHRRPTTRTSTTNNPDMGVHPTLMNPYEPETLKFQRENPKTDEESWGSYAARIAGLIAQASSL
jgi:hypothetical protein